MHWFLPHSCPALCSGRYCRYCCPVQQMMRVIADFVQAPPPVKLKAARMFIRDSMNYWSSYKLGYKFKYTRRSLHFSTQWLELQMELLPRTFIGRSIGGSFGRSVISRSILRLAGLSGNTFRRSLHLVLRLRSSSLYLLQPFWHLRAGKKTNKKDDDIIIHTKQSGLLG